MSVTFTRHSIEIEMMNAKMRRPMITERYVLAEHIPNKNVRRDPDDSESETAKKIKTEGAAFPATDTANALPYGGLSPANCRECGVRLPTTAADHDLVCVDISVRGSVHIRRPHRGEGGTGGLTQGVWLMAQEGDRMTNTKKLANSR